MFAARRRVIYTKTERIRRVGGPLEAFINAAVAVGMSAAEIKSLIQEKLGDLGGRPESGRS